MAVIVLAEEVDAIDLARNMRPEDVAEVEAAGGISPLAALTHGLQFDCYAARDAQGTILMFGTAPTDTPEVGLVWMLAAPRMVAYRREFLRRCRPVMDILHRRYPLLTNHVDARNKVHVRWLKWCGFSFLRTVSVAGLPFHEVVRLKHVCAPPLP